MAVVKNISKGMMLKLKSFILKMAQPVIKLYHDMMKKKWFRMLIAIVVNVIFKFLTVFSLIKALITGEFLPKGKTTLAILKTIRNGVKDSEEKLNKIDNSIKKNEEDKIKNKEERKQLFNNSFDGNINYGGLFFEFRDFINNDFEVYNEDVYFYNELTASQIPHASSISLPAGQTRVGYGFKLNGEKLNIGVDIVDNSIYGFDKSGDFDDDELQEFLDIVFGKGKTISSNHYKWKKGEWKKIFAAIETGKVGSDSSKSGDSSSKDSDSRKGGGGDGGSGSYSGRRGRIERDTEDDEEIGYDDGGGNGRGGDGGDGDGYRVGKNKLHVSGNKNNIYINDDEDYNPKKVNEPNMGFWNWMSRNGAAIISGVLIGLALGFIAFHVWTFWMSMSSQLAAQGAQLAALEKGQATILTAIQNIKPGPKAVYNIMNNSGAIAFSGNATQTIYNGAAALAKVAPHM